MPNNISAEEIIRERRVKPFELFDGVLNGLQAGTKRESIFYLTIYSSTIGCRLYFSQGDAPLILPVTALWLVTVPLMDMLATMLRRYRHGRNLVAADRSHLHHTLMDRGLDPRQTLLLLVVYASLCAALGLLLEAIPEYLSLLCYFVLFCGHCAFVLRAGEPRR